MAAQRLGDILVAHGAISRETLETNLASLRGKLGQFLAARNLISGQSLARSLAEQHQIPFVDFTLAPPDSSLFSPRDLAHYHSHRYVPYAKSAGKLTCATPEPSEDLRALLSAHYATPVTLVATGPYDLASYFATTAATASTRQARLGLRRKHPRLTADKTLFPHQMRAIALWALLPAAGMSLAPNATWQLMLLACNLFYFLSLYMKLQLFTHGHAQRKINQRTEPALLAKMAETPSESLPIYSILVPLYMESETVITRLIQSLAALDYPPEKLDIKLICEASDTATIATLKALKPPATMEIIAVPPSSPRTKPKACNVALQTIRGEFLVIYDAEDQPAPDQLKRAVAAFAMAGKTVACFQAALNYYNRDENLLTQLFAIEYSSLFNLHLPALERLRTPIPLGGTSNHLRVSALHEVGGWDAFNVTEDADLGIRLAYFGFHTRVLSSLTLEEAPITLRAWLKQRTRWVKGYIQTWLVYMRDAAELKRRLGGPAYYGFQFFVGAPALTFLLAPVFWFICAASIFGIIPAHLYTFTQLLCVIALFGGFLSSLLFARAVLVIERWHHMRRAMLVYPFYWLLHSIAAGCALYELATKPHYWAKTQHGVSRILRTT